MPLKQTNHQPGTIPNPKHQSDRYGGFSFPTGLGKPTDEDLVPKVFHQYPVRQRWSDLDWLRKILLVGFLIILGVTYFTKDRYKNVEAIMPEVTGEPIQSPTDSTNPVTFEKKGYAYVLTPIFDYDVSGLVVHTFKYDSWFSISRTDSAFPLDVCMIWGSNATGKKYQDESLTFSQDYRFCLYNYVGRLEFSAIEFSNNHLVFSSKELEKQALNISAGDQVRIRGRLVNITAKAISQTGRFESPEISWATSITRKDAGAGACEVIYVDDLQILKKGNPISHWLFSLSKLGILIVVLWTLIEWMYFAFMPHQKGRLTI